MSAVVKPVETKSDLKQFIMLPYTLYKDDPLWIPPLISQEKDQFDP
ncbi:N-acetyltransferase, partial [Candidatus Fermentibacteria bacterium]